MAYHSRLRKNDELAGEAADDPASRPGRPLAEGLGAEQTLAASPTGDEDRPAADIPEGIAPARESLDKANKSLCLAIIYDDHKHPALAGICGALAELASATPNPIDPKQVKPLRFIRTPDALSRDNALPGADKLPAPATLDAALHIVGNIYAAAESAVQQAKNRLKVEDMHKGDRNEREITKIVSAISTTAWGDDEVQRGLLPTGRSREVPMPSTFAPCFLWIQDVLTKKRLKSNFADESTDNQPFFDDLCNSLRFTLARDAEPGTAGLS